MLVPPLARQLDAGGLLDLGELRVQRPPVVVPGEHGRAKPGQPLKVLDHDRVQFHQLVALALVVLGAGDGGPGLQVPGLPGAARPRR